jgi:hypothetical protein
VDLRAEDRLAGTWKAFGERDQIDIRAAHDRDARRV